jgi:hypothetical protein
VWDKLWWADWIEVTKKSTASCARAGPVSCARGALYFHVESKRSLRPTRALNDARSLDGHRDDDEWIEQKLASAALEVAPFRGQGA